MIYLLWIAAALWAARALGAFRRYYKGPVSDHFDGTRFFNPGINVDKTQADLWKWSLNRQKAVWPKTLPAHAHPAPPARVEGDELRVTFIGHATFLIQTAGLNILTDPLFSDRASPIPFLGPKRVVPPAIALKDLPKIDIVLVSHNHYDHLDRRTLKRLWRRDKPVIVTPLGNEAIISLPAIRDIRALDWGQDTNVLGAHITLEQAYHWSARGLYDRRKALWGAFVIKTPGGNIYFAGDTAYIEGKIFKDAREKHGPFRFAMLPVGAYEPRWFMHNAHMNPDDACKAWNDLDRPQTLGMHFGTIQLTDEAIDAPAKELEAALNACAGKAEGGAAFRMPAFGECLKIG